MKWKNFLKTTNKAATFQSAKKENNEANESNGSGTFEVFDIALL
ncbi:MAG: hypothetical protein QF442_00295 [Candidatus Peribacteraceae bacterium]|nr:hypothetical protein [Candidatus Peribacteraceae bacterium]